MIEEAPGADLDSEDQLKTKGQQSEQISLVKHTQTSSYIQIQGEQRVSFIGRKIPQYDFKHWLFLPSNDLFLARVWVNMKDPVSTWDTWEILGAKWKLRGIRAFSDTKWRETLLFVHTRLGYVHLQFCYLRKVRLRTHRGDVSEKKRWTSRLPCAL